MKILIFIPHMGLGGVERSFINLSKEFKNRGHSVKFVSLNDEDNLKVKVLDIWKIDLWWIQNPISRTYYSVSTPDNKVMTIFKDTVEKRWYRQNY